MERVFSDLIFSRLLHLFHGGFGFFLGNSVTFLGESHVLDELGITTEKGFKPLFHWFFDTVSVGLGVLVMGGMILGLSHFILQASVSST